MNGKLRRAAHIVVFAVFTILLGVTLMVGEFSQWWTLVVIIWSYIDEATKPLIEGRHFSWFDVGLNLVGCGIGGVILMLTVMFRSVQVL